MIRANVASEGSSDSWDNYPNIRAASTRADGQPRAHGDGPWQDIGPAHLGRRSRSRVLVVYLSMSETLQPCGSPMQKVAYEHLFAEHSREGVASLPVVNTATLSPSNPSEQEQEIRELRARVDALERALRDVQRAPASAPLRRAPEPRRDDTILWAGEWLAQNHAEYAGKWVALHRSGLVASGDTLAEVMQVRRRPEFKDERIFVTHVS